ncbi:MAG: hypothetical protein OWU84_10520 [Firmicutes bacterium]|nr:hypothetical protein [Bacillota bacterium]
MLSPNPSPAPTDDEWRALYEAANAFYALKPWQWFDDNQIFGIYHSESHTVAYCCIMGALGEVLALGVYLGNRGYSGLKALMESGQDWASMEDAYAHQYALVASFENRNDLSRADREVIRRLGYKYRGRQSWPCFRFYEPGYVPSPISGEQARLLRTALEQAQHIVEEYRRQPEALRARPGYVLVRRPPSAGHQWVNVWEQEPPRTYPLEPAARPDKGVIKLARSLPWLDTAWDVDIFYLPITIGGPRERGQMPRTALVVDHESGMILGVLLEDDHFIERVFHAIIQTMRKMGGKPQALYVRQHLVALLLSPLAEALGIELVEVRLLPLVTEARRGLIASLRDHTSL